ncbi:hypothetical protein AB0M54_43335 [Actinoplanes sp. NPDC051470]|uniref:hypothetical protein n=1 Tax=unclassified Actinoplanes TaxID=2626549 RepID=UPI00342A88C8
MPAIRRALPALLAGWLLLTGCGDLPAASAQGLAGNDLVGAMVTQLTASAGLTYTAGYHLAGGTTATFTQAQKPLRQGYDYPGGRLVVSSSEVTDCRGASRPACTLTSPPATGSLPPALSAVQSTGLVPPPVVIKLLNTAALDQNVTIAPRDTTIAGHHATCLDLTGIDNAAARDLGVCVTNDGVLGSFKGMIAGRQADMTMTEYDPTARYTAFTPPPGARFP